MLPILHSQGHASSFHAIFEGLNELQVNTMLSMSMKGKSPCVKCSKQHIIVCFNLHTLNTLCDDFPILIFFAQVDKYDY